MKTKMIGDELHNSDKLFSCFALLTSINVESLLNSPRQFKIFFASTTMRKKNAPFFSSDETLSLQSEWLSKLNLNTKKQSKHLGKHKGLETVDV